MRRIPSSRPKRKPDWMAIHRKNAYHLVVERAGHYYASSGESGEAAARSAVLRAARDFNYRFPEK